MRKEISETVPEYPIETVQIGRQPILDRNLQTYGYELLYRFEDKGPEIDADGNLITARTLLFTFLEFGVKHLVGPHLAFVNFTRPLFLDMQPLMLDKERFVLEVLEDIKIDLEFVTEIRKLHESGYTIALDDYRFESHWEPILPYCAIIKVDILELDLEAYAGQIANLKTRGLLLLAEKVETHAEFEMALNLGFDLFQGYFFARPQVLNTRFLQNSQIILLKLLARINEPTIELDELARLVSQDPKLSFKVLRYINSAAFGFRQKIHSIQQAVMFIGTKKLKALVILFVMADMSSETPEKMKTGLVRAEFCRLINETLTVGDPESAYLVGLLSILDALLNQPMDQLVKEMPLDPDMTGALVEHTGTYGMELDYVLALEQGRFFDFQPSLIAADKLNALYIQAMISAEEILDELGLF